MKQAGEIRTQMHKAATVQLADGPAYKNMQPRLTPLSSSKVRLKTCQGAVGEMTKADRTCNAV